MILFPIFSTAVVCLWALVLISAPIYAPILTIPALISPVFTPLLSPAYAPTILILSEVCVGTVLITFPTCDPLDAPVLASSPPVALGPQRVFQLVAGLLVLGYLGIASYTKGTIRLTDGADSITLAPSDCPARPPSTFPFLPSCPPARREAGPGTNWTPLSQSDAAGSLRRQVLTRNTGVSTSGRIFRPSPADSGYQGSPLLSRRAASKQHQSRLRVVTSADVDSPISSGPLPASELCSACSGGDNTPLGGLSSTPLFNPPVRRGSGGDPFWAAGFAKRNSTPPDLLGKGVVVNFEAPSDLLMKTPSLPPLFPKNCSSNTAGFGFVPGATAPVPIEQTGVSDRKSAREARDAFLRLQAERGYAAPSRLYCNLVDERGTPSPARSPNIQALRDILESGRATLRRFNERRSAWLSSPGIRSRSLDKPSTAEGQASSIIPNPSAASRTSFKSSKQGPVDLEEGRSIFDLPIDMSMLVDEEIAFHEDEDDPTYPFPPFETAPANSREGKSALVAKMLDVPASTSADIGLRLLMQAIGEQGERSLYLDSEASSFEATMSVDSTLGEAPSFLNDILDLSVYRPVVVTKDQGTQRVPRSPTPALYALPEDTAIANNPSPSYLHDDPTPSPSILPPATSLSFGRIDGFLKDILEPPVHWFSHPTPTFEACDTRDLSLSSSLDDLKIAHDLPWLMDQSAPPSPIESRSGSPIPPSEEVISRVRARKAAAAAQKDQIPASTRDPENVSVESGRLETSMSFGRIADFLGDIWASPVRKFSNGLMRFEGKPGVNPCTLSATSSANAIPVLEEMSYLVDECIPSALVESLSGPSTSVPSFKNLVQNLSGMIPPSGVYSTASESHSLPSPGSPSVSDLPLASPVSSRPSSSSSGSSFTMEIPESTTLLCEESLADLDAVDGFWC